MAGTATDIKPLATFEIQSGHLCYGALHNIYHGASTIKSEGLPVPIDPVSGGTIRRHEADFNLPALKGNWHVYPLVGQYGDNLQTVAWFVAHSSVDPAAEADKILRVSGSPYEPDSGSTLNDEDTAREGLFVVNRYDWGLMDGRGKEEIQEAELPIDLPYLFSAVGVVDFERAHDFVNQLKIHRADQRDLISDGGGGVWLVLKDAEYQFARFGFEEEKKHARSFFFFGNHTDFTTTRFDGGGQQTLRKSETPAERFQRRLREGFDFSQRRLITTMFSDMKPANAELLGPYASDVILTRGDVDVVQNHLSQDPMQLDGSSGLDLAAVDAAVKESLERWRSESVDLINEILLSFLEYRIVPYLHDHSHASPETAVQTLFPDGSTDPQPGEAYNFTLAEDLRNRFTGAENQAASSSSTTTDPGHAPVKDRMRGFLENRSLQPGSEFLEGVCRVLAFITKDLIEMAKRSSIDSERFGHIMPSDVFLAVMNDTPWYQHNLSRSKTFWCA
ncbi:hypothetical protein PRZ48_012067 [Zasmidium cellare]|uniref:Uncharacterized protein n=1 Tax=Zasmidium cellare TaxID=395010 RepID=A0ABR0E495_ZASCE|nr:hypothetical protein PRZ48_012067 [Zasmidium cellare]